LERNDDYKKLADSYFDFLAERFPVMCASDEFDFLPRAENAARHYDKLDQIEAGTIEESIDTLRDFQQQFKKIDDESEDLERFIDIKLLQANAAGILIELDIKRSWQYNPLLYLKIGFIGLDHAANKPAETSQEVAERALSRLSSIPNILKQGIENIRSVPETYYQAALRMAQDCRQYLGEVAKTLSKRFDHHQDRLFKFVHDAEEGLKKFHQFLAAQSPESDRQFAVSTLETSLKDHFLSAHSPKDIFAIAIEEWHRILDQLQHLRSQIDGTKTWIQLYHAFAPFQVLESGIVALYADEIQRLQAFFSQNGFSEELLSAPVKIEYTPTYLKSVRSSASFAAAFSRDPQEESYFYISTNFPQHNSKGTDQHLQKRLNREFKMLTAHETIPGHHFLDSFRRRLANPIRRQIESPLFYEGWASYAESMLIEYGYLNDPLEALVSLKRELWRSARCQIDVGFTIGELSEPAAIDLLTTCGFDPAEATRQLDRFRLNPGYQLCYCYGSYEFKQLKNKYGHLFESKDFYRFLLEGGELPFDLIERRFEKRHQKE
jgi:uncharacterized protein (DUF885 family)